LTTAEKIKTCREDKGISQLKLANLSKQFNQSQISKIEKGDRKITDQDLISIANALGLKAVDLIGDSFQGGENKNVKSLMETAVSA